jgi:hypothetical protein
MAQSDSVTRCFFDITNQRPVLCFEDEGKARKFKEAFDGAELLGNKKSVALPTPHGLELICGAQTGETAYGKGLSSCTPYGSC